MDEALDHGKKVAALVAVRKRHEIPSAAAMQSSFLVAGAAGGWHIRTSRSSPAGKARHFP
jgi:antitoxin (DNA-binding transcriptional repressor) of toxin-antitoxin stability system